MTKQTSQLLIEHAETPTYGSAEHSCSSLGLARLLLRQALSLESLTAWARWGSKQVHSLRTGGVGGHRTASVLEMHNRDLEAQVAQLRRMVDGGSSTALREEAEGARRDALHAEQRWEAEVARAAAAEAAEAAAANRCAVAQEQMAALQRELVLGSEHCSRLQAELHQVCGRAALKG